MSLSVDGFWKSGFWSQTFWADGFWFEGAYVEEVFTGGSGYPVYKKRVKRHNISEMLDIAMRDIYEIATAKDEPQTTRIAAARIVKPYAKGNAKIPSAGKIDWVALNQDVRRVEMLVALYQQKLDDDEVVKMALKFYYY